MLASFSPRRESLAVLRAAAAVFFGAWFWIGLHAAPVTGATSANDLLPYQRLFRDLEQPLQRAYRNLEEGSAEAERVRAQTRSWPDVPALAAEGIPPFAADPTDKVGHLWSFVQQGTIVNYRGRPSTPGSPELLLVIQEPDPGSVDLGAGAADETHHLLPDGTLLHVTAWFRRAGAADAGPVVDRPYAEGWTQILAGNLVPPKESS